VIPRHVSAPRPEVTDNSLNAYLIHSFQAIVTCGTLENRQTTASFTTLQRLAEHRALRSALAFAGLARAGLAAAALGLAAVGSVDGGVDVGEHCGFWLRWSRMSLSSVVGFRVLYN